MEIAEISVALLKWIRICHQDLIQCTWDQRKHVCCAPFSPISIKIRFLRCLKWRSECYRSPYHSFSAYLFIRPFMAWNLKNKNVLLYFFCNYFFKYVNWTLEHYTACSAFNKNLFIWIKTLRNFHYRCITCARLLNTNPLCLAVLHSLHMQMLDLWHNNGNNVIKYVLQV